MDARLYTLLADHINEDLRELDTHANVNDMNGIIENIMYDIEERVLQYHKVVSEDQIK